jgi:RNA polymerase sigma factor (sigma-70 family)
VTDSDETPSLMRDAPADAQEFVVRMRPKIQTFLRRCGCEAGLAEEIAADSCYEVLRRWDVLRANPAYAGKEPASYLFKIAKRGFRARGPIEDRRNDRYPLIDISDILFEEPTLTLTGTDGDVCDRVHEVLLQLPPRDRQLVWLRHIERFSTKETAAIMNMSESNVKTKLAAALASWGGITVVPNHTNTVFSTEVHVR